MARTEGWALIIFILLGLFIRFGELGHHLDVHTIERGLIHASDEAQKFELPAPNLE